MHGKAQNLKVAHMNLPTYCKEDAKNNEKKLEIHDS